MDTVEADVNGRPVSLGIQHATGFKGLTTPVDPIGEGENSKSSSGNSQPGNTNTTNGDTPTSQAGATVEAVANSEGKSRTNSSGSDKNDIAQLIQQLENQKQQYIDSANKIIDELNRKGGGTWIINVMAPGKYTGKASKGFRDFINEREYLITKLGAALVTTIAIVPTLAVTSVIDVFNGIYIFGKDQYDLNNYIDRINEIDIQLRGYKKD